MRLISNTVSPTHIEYMKVCAEKSDHIILVSPFLFDDFSECISTFDLKNLKKIELVTSLKVTGDNQIRKPMSLLSFLDAITLYAPHSHASIHFDNSLHGKVYLFKSKGLWLGGIITSANLTDSGMNHSHEWGIYTQDESLLNEVERQIDSGIEYRNVPREIISKKLLPAADSKRTKVAVSVDAGLINLLKRHVEKEGEIKSLDLGRAAKIFLKPIGYKDKPILLEDEECFGAKKILRFPKPMPQDVFPGDIIISFGTGSRAILCIHTTTTNVEAISYELQKDNADQERWPWFVNGYNHTPNFGDFWWKYNITIDELREGYLLNNPYEDISLGAFNYGAGRLSISANFAEFITQRILKIEHELSLSNL